MGREKKLPHHDFFADDYLDRNFSIRAVATSYRVARSGLHRLGRSPVVGYSRRRYFSPRRSAIFAKPPTANRRYLIRQCRRNAIMNREPPVRAVRAREGAKVGSTNGP